MKNTLQELLDQALTNLRNGGDLGPDNTTPDYTVERSKSRTHGDFASNLAMMLAKPTHTPPRKLAERIIACLPEHPVLDHAEVAGPGFINLFLSTTAYHAEILNVLALQSSYGHNKSGAGRKVQVEFVSANPTGPLHVGHGRGAAVGDSLCRLLEASGWQVTREFYYNDAGQQINKLALSVQARALGLDPNNPHWPEDGYRGEYISEVAQAFLTGATVEADGRHETGGGDAHDLEAVRRFAIAWLRHEQDLDLRAFGVDFDVYFLESTLHTEGKVDAAVKQLIDSGHTFEKDGALWLRTTAFGDDKDRVMRKSDGSYTYFIPDVAYHVDKWQRGFERVINEQGADHHSTITRVRAGLQALGLGIPSGWPEYVLHQMVAVMRHGQEVKLSKRAGSYVTLRDLIDEVGRDATRWFLVARKPDSQLTFDIDVARAQSNDNPVYYVQYAHARIASVLTQASERGMVHDEVRGRNALAKLDSESSIEVMVMLSRYPEVIESATHHLEPHLVASYLVELAGSFHAWYNSEPFLVDDAALRDARLLLARATGQVLANGLGLMGVSAPESM